MSAPNITLVLTIPVAVASNGYADLRRASTATAPRSSRVRLQAGAAKYFDTTDVPLLAESLRHADAVEINSTEPGFVIALRAALLDAWAGTGAVA